MFKMPGLSREIVREELESFASQVLKPEIWALADRLEDVIHTELHSAQVGKRGAVGSDRLYNSESPSTQRNSWGVRPMSSKKGSCSWQVAQMSSERRKDDEISWLGRPRRSYVAIQERKTEDLKQALLRESEAKLAETRRKMAEDGGVWTPMFAAGPPEAVKEEMQPVENRTKSREPLLAENDANGETGDDGDIMHRSVSCADSEAIGVCKQVSMRGGRRQSFESVSIISGSSSIQTEIEPDRISQTDLHTPTPWKRRITTRLSGELFHIPEPRSSVVLTPVMKFVMDIRFTYVIGAFIISNAVSMGWECDYMAMNWRNGTPKSFLMIDIFFCTVFTVELLLRLLVYGWHFFSMMGWQWNYFDICMVVFQLADVTCAVMARATETREVGHPEVGMLRMMRIFRLFRVLRLVRLMSVFSELRMFIVSVADSMRSLFWTIMLILLAMYISGIYLTQLVTDHKIANPRSTLEHPDLEQFYGSLGRSMLTLYETISEGVPWSEVMLPLARHCSPWMALVFSLWMAFTMFAMLNVITGVFVESALHTANDDKKKLLMYQMRQWFAEADADGTETLTWDEFRRHLENPKMERFLKIVDLDTQEAWDLFHLLDIHGRGEIHADDFVNGCVRVTGTAKAIDLVTLMQQYKVTMEKLSEHSEFVENVLTRLDEELSERKKTQEKNGESQWSSELTPVG